MCDTLITDSSCRRSDVHTEHRIRRYIHIGQVLCGCLLSELVYGPFCLLRNSAYALVIVVFVFGQYDEEKGVRGCIIGKGQ